MRLDHPRLAAILEREHAAARAQRAARRPPGAGPMGAEDFRTSARHRASYLAIGPDQGRWLHGLARAMRARRIVEFGSSFGISALYLASAAQAEGGAFTGSEYHPEKAERARAVLAEAGLEAAEIRLGDARETLAGAEGPIDLLFLDGAKELYRPMLDLLAPRLEAGAVVVADNIDPERAETRDFLDAVEDPAAWITARPRFGKGGMSVSVRP